MSTITWLHLSDWHQRLIARTAAFFRRRAPRCDSQIMPRVQPNSAATINCEGDVTSCFSRTVSCSPRSVSPRQRQSSNSNRERNDGKAAAQSTANVPSKGDTVVVSLIAATQSRTESTKSTRCSSCLGTFAAQARRESNAMRSLQADPLATAIPQR